MLQEAYRLSQVFRAATTEVKLINKVDDKITEHKEKKAQEQALSNSRAEMAGNVVKQPEAGNDGLSLG
jgi:hypothetical protein